MKRIGLGKEKGRHQGIHMSTLHGHVEPARNDHMSRLQQESFTRQAAAQVPYMSSNGFYHMNGISSNEFRPNEMQVAQDRVAN